MLSSRVANFLRYFGKLLAMAGATAILYPLWWIAIGQRRRVVRFWHRMMGRILGLTVCVEGTVPAIPFILVSNHLSYLDVFAFGSIATIVFVAKSEIKAWPLAGLLASTTGTIFIDRKSPRDTLRVSRSIAKTLSLGNAVLLFPEGTTTAPGMSLLPFKSPLLEIAVRERLPVHTAAIRYSDSRAEWRGDDPFGPQLRRFLGTRGVEATIRFGKSIEADDRKHLSAALWSEVHQLVVSSESVGEPPPEHG